MTLPPQPKGKRIYILLPGIKTKTSDNDSWAPAMASTICRLCDDAKAVEFRYFTHALFHRVGMKERVGWVIDLAYGFWEAGYEVILVGHSDGCEIVRQCIIEGPSIFSAAHLIAGACEADFEENGLNQALRKGKVGELILYVSKGDKVLDRFARASIRGLSWLGIAYGTLGFDGPQNLADDVASSVDVVRRHSLRHGQWFEGANWDRTFESITRRERTL